MIKETRINKIAGWLLFILGLAAIVAAGLLLMSCSASSYTGQNFDLLIDKMNVVLTGLAFTAISRLLTQFRSENSIGWLIAILGICAPLGFGLGAYTQCTLEANSPPPFAGLSVWLLMIFSTILILIQFILLPALFPTGTFISRPWKQVIGVAAAIFLFLSILALIAPGPMTMNGTVGRIPFDNPFGLPLPWLRGLESFLLYAIPFSGVLAGLISIAAFVARFRGSAGDERQQLKWIAYFLTTVVAVHLIGFELLGGIFYPAVFEHWSYDLIIVLSFVGLPLVIGLAIFKYRLYDIDLIIRRTLVYSLLTGLLALVYFGSVVLLQTLFEALTGQGSPAAIVISTLGIAALFTPLRRRIQEAIDRRFYRRKYDAVHALESFANSAREETNFDRLKGELLKLVQETVQPEDLTLWIAPIKKTGRRSGGIPEA